ncbi:MAG: hypothetical protein M3255_02735 [Pseudomonadota bacterium]|nr:hypothetical protein [Pseudomonadota bacterium]
MRWLSITLLIANIAYFSWEYDQQLKKIQTEPAPPPPLPADIERLTLLRELAQPPLILPHHHGQQAATGASNRTIETGEP